ncbi:MAG: thrS, partial [Actinobacteria bacterium]|nr:thrS [Actinomycetota bacterium]
MTLLELAKTKGKAKVAIAAKVGGALMDLSRTAPETGEVTFVTPGDPEGMEIVRHSTAHVMAAAVKELFPEAKITIGPS